MRGFLWNKRTLVWSLITTRRLGSYILDWGDKTLVPRLLLQVLGDIVLLCIDWRIYQGNFLLFLLVWRKEWNLVLSLVELPV